MRVLPADRRRRGRVVVGVLSAYALLFVAWCVSRPGGDWTRTVVADAVFLPVNATAAGIAWRIVRNQQQPFLVRRAWTMIAIAYGAWWLGDVTWFVLEVGRREAPFPSIADAGYLLFYPLLALGLLTLMGPLRGSADRARLVLDAATVALGATMVVWYLVIEPTARESGAYGLATVLTLAYPVADLVIVAGVAAVLMSPRRVGNETALRLLIAGALGFVVADVGYAHLSLSGAYGPGDWPDAAWLLAQVLFVAAAVAQNGAIEEPPDASSPPAAAIGVVPSISIVAAYGFVAWVGLRHFDNRLHLLLGLLLVLTVIVAARRLVAQLEIRALLGAALESEARSRRFLADAAHQLRTPVAGIQACAELLADPKAARQPELLAGVLRETKRIGELVNSLLRVARLDEGEDVDRVAVDLLALCADEAKGARIRARGIHVAAEWAGDTAPIVRVDPKVVREVITNLVDNACRHARSRIDLAIYSGPQWAEVHVCDDGPGVDEADAERIFDRFVSLDNEGSGLGLPIARDLARVHGGDVTYHDGAFIARFATE